MSNSEKVTGRIEDGIQIIAVKGKIVYGAADEYREEIGQVVESADAYIMDISEVSQIDSLGFGVLVSFSRKFLSERKSLAVVIKDEMILELFEASNLHMVFKLCRSLEEAKTKLAE